MSEIAQPNESALTPAQKIGHAIIMLESTLRENIPNISCQDLADLEDKIQDLGMEIINQEWEKRYDEGSE